MLAIPCRFDRLAARRQLPGTEEGGPRELASPGHGQPVQLRFQTELTAEEHVSREEWRNATVPPCLKGRCRHRCGLMRHGTYGRKTPVPMRVARFYCPGCRTTISRLPDFAAARRRGSLQEIEDDMIVLAGSPSRWAAARQLFPHGGRAVERDPRSSVRVRGGLGLPAGRRHAASRPVPGMSRRNCRRCAPRSGRKRCWSTCAGR